MKKKALLASAVALVTASAMSFAPVSYKVIDKAHAATADVEQAASKLEKIFAALKSDTNLSTAYNAMLTEVEADAGQLADIQTNMPNLEAGLQAKSIVVADVEAALVDLVETLAVEYKASNAQFDDVSANVEGKLDALKAALGTIADNVDRDDLAKLLQAIQAEALEQIGAFSYAPGTDYSDLIYSSVLAAVQDQWNASATNEIVAVLKEVYGATNFADFESDITNAKTNVQQYIEAQGKEDVYTEGAAALAISYAKYYLAEVKKPLLDNYYGNSVTLLPDLFGVSAFPLSALDWSASNGTSNGASIGITNGQLVLNVSTYGTTTVTATLKANPKLPAAFIGVELFSQQITVSSASNPGGGVGVVDPNLSLVSDYQAKASAISGKLADYLTANPELYNNSLKLELAKQLEEQLRQALLVQAAGAVTVSNGVSTLNITPAQMENIYNTQLSTVLNAVKEALKAKGLDLALAPVLTYNIGVTSNGEVNLSKALIDSLISKGIATVGVKTGDAVVEADLSQLTGASKLTVKKAASSVTGAKSDTYSIAVVDANGKALTGFEKQYRVTLPVNGTSSKVTVAKLADGSQTLIGGQYDPATRTITFYTNELGDFVVVENSAQFNDIAKLAWAKDPIQLLADKGLLLGKGNGVFDPNGNVTRAEFTAMLVRALNLNASSQVTFNDVSENAWYYDAVSAAKAYGIVNGRSASVFDPNAKISREEMASILANALKVTLDFEAPANTDELIKAFVDGGDVAAVHRANVALLKNEGIIQGKGHDNYDPKGNATRAESAVVIEKIFNLR